ncbi:MAG TPA: DUF5666 domain-containing protein [Mycobacteriales bacterium]|nr:DUF5666 domain-containing protein [Mycobacteriales bacterium]
MIRTPRLAAAAVAGAVLFVPAAATTAYAAGHGHGHGHTKHAAKAHHHGKPAAKKFTATGTVASVDGDTLVIHDKGGSRDLHGTDVTVTVTDTTKINLDDAPATLADLVAGDHVMANGTRGSDDAGNPVLTARHVNASSQDSSDDTADGDTSGDTSGTTDASGGTTDTSGGTTDGSGTTDTSGGTTDTSGGTTDGSGGTQTATP